MAVITDEKRIDEVLDRGVIVNILPTKEDFRKLLMSGKRMKIYIGFDATASTLHLSHAKNIMLLEDFRKLGHEVVLLFGDFTARIGDPSDQIGTRSMLSKEQALKNIEDWKTQINNLIDFKNKENPVDIALNGEWLAKLNLEEVLDLASNVTVQQMIERDMFQKRIKEGKHIFLHEFLYPLMQGYDSVSLEVDAELCGTDQTFNALMGRTLLRKIKNKEKFVVTVNLMENPKTGELMSKSKGTGVFLNTTPSEMYGGIMSQSDDMTKVFFVNCTRVPLEEINTILQKDNPLDAKKIVAKEIVKIIHGEKDADEAEINWANTFQKGEVPEEMTEVKIEEEETLMVVLVKEKIVSSNGDFRRLINEGAITNLENDEKITDAAYIPEKGIRLRIGKKRFVKIV